MGFEPNGVQLPKLPLNRKLRTNEAEESSECNADREQ